MKAVKANVKWLKNTSYATKDKKFVVTGQIDRDEKTNRDKIAQVILPEADLKNLAAGGNLEIVSIEGESEEGSESADEDDHHAVHEPVASGDGSEGDDGDAGPDASANPDLTCEACGDGRVFASKAALGSHKSAKH